MNNQNQQTEQQPITYSRSDNDLELLHSVQLIIWENGLCIAGFDSDNEPLMAKQFAFTQWNKSAITNIIVNEPMVAGPQPVTHVWLSEERQIISPRELFDAQEAEKWLPMLHFIDTSETIMHSQQPDSGKIISYPAANEMLELMGSFFEEAELGNFSGLMICEPTTEKPRIDMVVLNNFVWLSLYQNHKLMLHQAFVFSTLDDCVYRILNLLQLHQIAVPEVQIKAKVIHPNHAEITPELKAYFPQMNIRENMADNFISLLSLFSNICAS